MIIIIIITTQSNCWNTNMYCYTNAHNITENAYNNFVVIIQYMYKILRVCWFPLRLSFHKATAMIQSYIILYILNNLRGHINTTTVQCNINAMITNRKHQYETYTIPNFKFFIIIYKWNDKKWLGYL